MVYEEFCESPEEHITQVYKLLGEEPPDRVLSWFRNHTQATSTSAERDKMGLERDSRLTAIRWQKELPAQFICRIEQQCSDLLNYLNLKFICVS